MNLSVERDLEQLLLVGLQRGDDGINLLDGLAASLAGQVAAALGKEADRLQPDEQVGELGDGVRGVLRREVQGEDDPLAQRGQPGEPAPGDGAGPGGQADRPAPFIVDPHLPGALLDGVGGQGRGGRLRCRRA